MQIHFKNLKKSELIKETIFQRLEDDFVRFPDLVPKAVSMTVAMENSPAQAGPDLFRVKLRVTQGKYQGLILEKSGQNFYSALAELNDSLVERLNRFSKKQGESKRRPRKKRMV